MGELKNPYLLARCGSVIFGADTEDSDVDYVALVSAKDYPEMPKLGRDRIKTPEADYFLMRVEDIGVMPLSICPNLVTIYDTAVAGGSCQELYDYWKTYATELANMHPFATYSLSLQWINMWLDNREEKVYKTAIWVMGVLDQAVETGDFLTAKKLSPYWVDLYHKADRGELSIMDMLELEEKMNSKKYWQYYKNRPINQARMDDYAAFIENLTQKGGV